MSCFGHFFWLQMFYVYCNVLSLLYFLQGLQPVVSVAKNKEGTKMDPIDEICPLISELRSSRFRDIVSAPF